jgi:hypothetical protein
MKYTIIEKSDFDVTVKTYYVLYTPSESLNVYELYIYSWNIYPFIYEI